MGEWTRATATKDERAAKEKQEHALTMDPVWKQYLTGGGKRLYGSGATMTTIPPEQRLNDLLNALDRLDTLGYQRSATQKLFHKAFVVAVLKQIYGRDIHRHVGELMRRFDVGEIRPDVIICAIRRGGKTFSVALFAAAYITTQPGVVLNIYSTCKRTARKLQALIFKMVVALSGTPAVVRAYNQEELVVECHGTTSTVNSLPSSVEVCFCGRGREVERSSFFVSFGTCFPLPLPDKGNEKDGVRKRNQGTSKGSGSRHSYSQKKR